MTRRVLVTGISGQDGGYLAEQLVADGDVVHGIMRDGEPVPLNLSALGDRVVLHRGDLLEGARMRDILSDADPDELYNLAGISSVATSWADPVLTARVNALAVAQLLDLTESQQGRTGKRTRFIQASSAEIFAGTTVVPQDEATALAPRSPYGAAKAFAHQLVQVYRAKGLHASNVILYNHESPRRPTTFVTRKITSAVAAIARGEAHEIVLGNLDARRDWGWAPDYVDAMVRAARREVPGDFVIATGESHTIREFAELALRTAEIDRWDQRIRSDPYLIRADDAADLVGDATRAREVLGWTPTVPFVDVVARMVRHDLDGQGRLRRTTLG